MEIKYGFSRFSNKDRISCYINSILGIMQHMPHLKDYIYNKKFMDISETDDSSIIQSLHKIIYISLNNDNYILNLVTFKNLIKSKNEMWNDNTQQDSQEFLIFLISQIEKEISNKSYYVPGIMTNSNSDFKSIISVNNMIAFQAKEYSPIQDMMYGMMQYESICRYCKNRTYTYPPFNIMSIDVKSNLYSAIKSLTTVEVLDKDNMLSCSLCGLKTRAERKISFWKLPPLLTIHIKRFKKDNYGQFTGKNTNNLDYPLEIQLEEYFDNSSPHKQKSKYKLYAINLHHSHNGASSGHYTSFVKSHVDNKWYHINDDKSIKEVRNKSDLQDSDAYILFYVKV